MLTAAGPLTADGMIVGTLQYMSPEQLDGREADSRSDVFACCVGLRAAACVDDGGERDGLAEVAATDRADLEFPDEIRNESFPAVTSVLDRPVLVDDRGPVRITVSC